MTTEQKEFLNLVRLPTELTAEEAALFLGYDFEDITILMQHHCLIPLGNPAQNAHKYFLTSELLKLADDNCRVAQMRIRGPMHEGRGRAQRSDEAGTFYPKARSLPGM